ncbi:hypothetical protein EBB59_09210 [Lysobacter pythonis]|uniref:Uncharacterized protein n=1 Tax=Solilutibacter pythonis TaxID=2483112 RepID=A0A3M2HYN2_9GAMM|nr:hypothetical protein [Lysobacter pythonis]RMH90944.1 hypothetical protein EBB59_09210 [Lysobacter pythonis]
MNAIPHATTGTGHALSAALPFSVNTRPPRRRERDIGVGYGRSSGYADERRGYAPARPAPVMFRIR